MKTRFNQFLAPLLSATALAIAPSVTLAATPAFTDANWTALGSGLNGEVYVLAVSGSNVYVGGSFTTAGGNAANYIAKWDGKNWSALGSGMNGAVGALAVSGSDLYAGGQFTMATNSGGAAVTVNQIAKWNGSSWSALGSGVNNAVTALAVLGSDVYAGGLFTMATNSGGATVTVNQIAKWNGSAWSALGSGVGGGYPQTHVGALAVSGSDVYAGGIFRNAGGTAANYIAKWDGSTWSALGLGMNDRVLQLAVSGSDLYAVGWFRTATNSGGVAVAVNWIAKWNGSEWSALGSGMNGDVYGLAVSGSEVYAGGFFTTAGDTAASRIAKWNGDVWNALGSGTGGGGGYPWVYTLALSGSNLYAGGEFTTAGGKAANYIARAYLPALPALSVAGSGPNVTVSWPSTNTADFTLEQSAALNTAGNWTANSDTIADDGTNKSVTLPATNSPQLFRLRGP